MRNLALTFRTTLISQLASHNNSQFNSRRPSPPPSSCQMPLQGSTLGNNSINLNNSHLTRLPESLVGTTLLQT